MKRRYFIGSVVAASVAATIGKSFMSESLTEKTPRMPVFFFGHGSPMNAVESNPFTHFLKEAMKDVPTPKAILVVSAHWMSDGVKVLRLEHPKTIHDFGGFPQELYQILYPAPGNLAMSDRAIKLLAKYHAEADTSWGLDHGTWTLLKYLYPKADVPVFQLSMSTKFKLKEHLEVAHELQALRDEGVLIIGSGNITHNLRLLNFEENPRPFVWAAEFDELIKQALLKRDVPTLLAQHPEQHRLWQMAHPTLEHYIPLLYCLGASQESDKVQFPYEDFQLGSLSMRSVKFG